MKKLMLAALVSLAILPGCGKKKDAAVTTGVGVAAIGTSTVGLQGNCFNLYGVSPGSGAVISFSGTGYISNGALIAQYLQGAASITPSGTSFSHSNGYGDSLIAYSNGNYVYASVNLHPNTVSAIQLYKGGRVCGLSINSTIGYGNVLDISSHLTVPNNYGQTVSIGISI